MTSAAQETGLDFDVVDTAEQTGHNRYWKLYWASLEVSSQDPVVHQSGIKIKINDSYTSEICKLRKVLN